MSHSGHCLVYNSETADADYNASMLIYSQTAYLLLNQPERLCAYITGLCDNHIEYFVAIAVLHFCTYSMCPEKKSNFFVISSIKLGRFWCKLVHRFQNKFASKIM